jgi:hypothetical protein
LPLDPVVTVELAAPDMDDVGAVARGVVAVLTGIRQTNDERSTPAFEAMPAADSAESMPCCALVVPRAVDGHPEWCRSRPRARLLT